MAHKPVEKPQWVRRTLGQCRICGLMVDASHSFERDKRGRLAHHQCVEDQKRLVAHNDGADT